eukprot:2602234-Amphidinium_carterae.1
MSLGADPCHEAAVDRVRERLRRTHGYKRADVLVFGTRVLMTPVLNFKQVRLPVMCSRTSLKVFATSLWGGVICSSLSRDALDVARTQLDITMHDMLQRAEQERQGCSGKAEVSPGWLSVDAPSLKVHRAFSLHQFSLVAAVRVASIGVIFRHWRFAAQFS